MRDEMRDGMVVLVVLGLLALSVVALVGTPFVAVYGALQLLADLIR